MAIDWIFSRSLLVLALFVGATGSAMLLIVPFASATAQTSPLEPAIVVSQAKAAPMVDGEVRKVDKDAGKITLKHGPIPNLEMPAMTMVFRVKDPTMLDKVKDGDKVRFAADKVGGAYTVTAIETMK